MKKTVAPKGRKRFNPDIAVDVLKRWNLFRRSRRDAGTRAFNGDLVQQAMVEFMERNGG